MQVIIKDVAGSDPDTRSIAVSDEGNLLVVTIACDYSDLATAFERRAELSLKQAKQLRTALDIIIKSKEEDYDRYDWE